MDKSTETKRCEATTQSGKRCKNPAQPGSSFCHIHQPADTQMRVSDEGSTTADDGTAIDLQKRKELIEELDSLIIQVREILPDYSPPVSTTAPSERDQDQGENAKEGEGGNWVADRLRGSIGDDLFDPDVWKGMWYMASSTLRYQGDLMRRRITGEYETDEWGLDWEFIEMIRPFLDFLYKFFWRIEASGIDNIPDYERAMLVCNHSVQPAWDSTMIMTTLLNEHPAQRLARFLYNLNVPTIPFVSSVMVKLGQAADLLDNGVRLLEQDELIGVFPEGTADFRVPPPPRYTVGRFRNIEFIKMALLTGSAIIPVSLLSSTDEHLARRMSEGSTSRYDNKAFSALLPFSRRRMLSPMPIPTKMYVEFGEPMIFDDLVADDVQDLALVSRLADEVRQHIQQMLEKRRVDWGVENR